jgi:hypothetical protein
MIRVKAVAILCALGAVGEDGRRIVPAGRAVYFSEEKRSNTCVVFPT